MADSGIKRGGLPVSKQQDKVIKSVLEHSLTIVGAGAGSGKSHTTIAAVLELLQQNKADIDQMILITYTNTAANNIRNEIEKIIYKRTTDTRCSATQQFWRRQHERLTSAYIGTIHSFCRMLLSTYGYNEKIARSADITYPTQLRLQIIDDAINRHISSTYTPKLIGSDTGGKVYKLKNLLFKAMDEVNNQGYNMEDVRTWTSSQAYDEGKPYREVFATMLLYVHREFNKRKAEKGVLDSHDLLHYTHQLLASPEDGERTINRLSQRYRYLFIDEFQDTNRLQLEIVQKLLPADTSKPGMKGVLLVGDQKQSIFAFSGASPSLMRELADERKIEILPLNVARRPTLSFLNLQNHLLEVVGQKHPGLNEKLESFDGTFVPTIPLPPLTFIATPPDASIAEKVVVMARAIRDLLSGRIHPKTGTEPRALTPGDIVILARNNQQLQDYFAGLQEELKDVKFRLDRGDPFYHKPEIVATYRILRTIIHYPDDYILSQAVGAPYLDGVDASGIESFIMSYGKQTGTPLTQELSSRYPAIFNKLAELRKRVKRDTVPQFLENLYRTFDVRGYYLKHNKPEAIPALERLREIARSLFSNDQALTIRTFVDILENNILMGKDIKEEAPAESSSDEPLPYIRLQTIHRAKGSEFQVVMLPDAQEEIITETYEPNLLIESEHGLEVKIGWKNTRSACFAEILAAQRKNQSEEEMRIFYVALTRAKQSVVILGTDPMQSPQAGIGPQHWNAWQDPIWVARPSLEACGAIFRTA